MLRAAMDAHYHIYVGYGASSAEGAPPTGFLMYAKGTGYSARSTANYIGRQVAGGKPYMVRACRCEACEVLDGRPDRDFA